MCGWLWGISGCPFSDEGGRHPFSVRRRLLLSLLASIVLHVTVVALEDVGGSLFPGPSVPYAGASGASSIEVSIRRLPPRLTASRLDGAKAGGEVGDTVTSHASIGKNRNFGLADDSPPILEEDIDFEVNDPRVVGFMILRLDVGVLGEVAASQVVYSDLPEAVQAEIVRGFASAAFVPARVRGEVVPATVLLKVVVE